jgi:hypothetical protein
MRATFIVVGTERPTAEQMQSYSDKMNPLATVSSYTDATTGVITIDAASITALLYAANFLGIKGVIIAALDLTK